MFWNNLTTHQAYFKGQEEEKEEGLFFVDFTNFVVWPRAGKKKYYKKISLN